MQISWNSTSRRYEGTLITQGTASEFAGFRIGELVWTATPTGQPRELREEQERRAGANGISSYATWYDGTIALEGDSPDEFVSMPYNIKFRRIK
jgi:hypothetical protein